MMSMFAILAQTPFENRLKGLRGAFDNRPADPTDLTGAIILFGCVIGIAVIWVVARKWSQPASGNSDANHAIRMFDSMTRRLGLSWRDRFVLRMFARGSQLPRPALILFDETLFDRQSERWLESISFAPLRNRGRLSLEALRSRSFLTD
jgi:hypothetical protein